jgi:hypothetical protein
VVTQSELLQRATWYQDTASDAPGGQFTPLDKVIKTPETDGKESGCFFAIK